MVWERLPTPRGAELLRAWKQGEDVSALEEALRIEARESFVELGLLPSEAEEERWRRDGPPPASEDAALLLELPIPGLPGADLILEAWRLLELHGRTASRGLYEVHPLAARRLGRVLKAHGLLRGATGATADAPVQLALNLIQPEHRLVLDWLHIQERDLASLAQSLDVPEAEARRRQLAAEAALAAKVREWSDWWLSLRGEARPEA